MFLALVNLWTTSAVVAFVRLVRWPAMLVSGFPSGAIDPLTETITLGEGLRMVISVPDCSIITTMIG